MDNLKICKHSNGRGYCSLMEAYCVEGPCKDEELVEYVPVVHGEWKINSDGYYPYCPICNKEPKGGMSDFCPNCGADMCGTGMSTRKVGRMVELPKVDSSDYQGLKVKYCVYKAQSGELVNDCFVLRPEKDKAAREALKSYALACDNKSLSNDIISWLGRICSYSKAVE